MTALHAALQDTDQFFDVVEAGNGNLREVVNHEEQLFGMFSIAKDLHGEGTLPIVRRVVDEGLVVSAKVHADDDWPYGAPKLSSEVIGANDGTNGLMRLNYSARLLNPNSVYATRLQKWTLRWGLADSDDAHIRTFASLRPHHQSCGEFARLLVRDEVVNGETGVVSSDLQYRSFHNLLDANVISTVSEFEAGTVKDMLQ
jgi:hypothetical protein